jgi:NhaP-type Na+/H+ and K+/H+ antiporter
MENIMSHFLDTLTEEEQKIFLGKDSDDKKQIKKERISAIKEAAQAIANATYTELENGKQITVAERAVLRAFAKVIEEGDIKGLIELAKLTGDFKQEVEVKVSALEQMVAKVSGDKF